jgi:ABC-type multidrug transport system permease subunit
MFRGWTSIVYKETIHILRDPRTLFLVLLVPGVQLTLFGYAIDLDVKNIPTAVYNMDGRQASRELVDTFRNTGYFEMQRFVGSDDELLNTVIRGEVKVAIKIPPDYSDALLDGTSAQVQVLIDGSDSNVAMQALNVSNAIGLRESMSAIAGTAKAGGDMAVDVRSRVLFNPDMKTPNFIVPGLVGLIMQLVTMFLTAFAVVREKENGTLEQLMVTPVSRLGLMLGKLAPYAVIGVFETAIVVLLMWGVFNVPVAGSVTLLAFFSVIFLFTALGLGLLISTIANSQMEAIQMAFVVVLPSVLLSGFIFPQESMPYPIYLVGQLIPVTYFIRILRGIILRGAGFYDLYDQGVWLALIGLVILIISASRFRKTLA